MNLFSYLCIVRNDKGKSKILKYGLRHVHTDKC